MLADISYKNPELIQKIVLILNLTLTIMFYFRTAGFNFEFYTDSLCDVISGLLYDAIWRNVANPLSRKTNFCTTLHDWLARLDLVSGRIRNYTDLCKKITMKLQAEI